MMADMNPFTLVEGCYELMLSFELSHTLNSLKVQEIVVGIQLRK